jgi:N-acyl-D-amino-acid deacylase
MFQEGFVDVVLRNARVIDGTGRTAVAADVAISEGRITEVGTVDARPDVAEVDLDGLVLAPGFIDAHTHYDAQVLWDPDITPSCWHGVTTVVMGNCGFGVAPTRPEHRTMVLKMLENVEGMPIEALSAGVTWSFETFPEYLDAVDRIDKRLNVAAYVGHSAIRNYVLGSESNARPSTAEETDQMADLVAEAMDAGAIGFSTSGSPTHFGGDGSPVPSRLALFEEVCALVEPLGRVQRGVIASAPGPDLHVPQFAELSRRTGRPVTWAGVLTAEANPGRATEQVAASRHGPGSVWPQITCYPLTVEVSLDDPYSLNQVGAFREALGVDAADLPQLYADPAWRARAKEQVAELWGSRLALTTVQSEAPDGTAITGPTLGELGAAAGVHPLDYMLDRAIAEDLTTRFRVVLVNDGQAELDELLRGSDTLLALSDAGAHTSYLCDADFTTHLLGWYVRERAVLSLEHAVWRLTGHPASVFGLHDRGRIAPGYVADLVAFDADVVGPETPKRVSDLPGGARRMVSRSAGIEHVWVNGVPIRRGGRDVEGARPGVLIRGADGPATSTAPTGPTTLQDDPPTGDHR